MSITFFDPDTGDRVMLPSKNEVCTRCFGSGTHDSWDNGMTAEEMYEWGDDFVDDYFAGYYDTVCEECNGNNVVAVIDEQRCTPEQIEVQQILVLVWATTLLERVSAERLRRSYDRQQ